MLNLVAHSHYKRVPHYRHFSPKEEEDLLNRPYNRVTDTCIPEEEACRRLQRHFVQHWKTARRKRRALFPARVHVQRCLERRAEAVLRDRPEELLAAGCRGEEPADLRARLGRLHDRQYLRRRTASRANLKTFRTVKSGIEYMMSSPNGTAANSAEQRRGLLPDRRRHRGRLPDLRGADDVPGSGVARVRSGRTSARFSDSTTSYGSYSGAVPNEKITWGKLDTNTPAVYRRVRRDDSSAADFRVHFGSVS